MPATQHISAEKAAAFIGAKSRSTLNNYRKVQTSDHRSVSPSSASSMARFPVGSRVPASLPMAPRMLPHRSLSTSALDGPSYIYSSAKSTVRLVHRSASGASSTPGTPATLVSTSVSGDTMDIDEADLSPHSPSQDLRAPSERQPERCKEPQLSWFLTIILLLSVTMVSFSSGT